MQGELLAIGPMTRPITTPALSAPAVGLRFGPGIAPQLLRIGAGELTDTRVPLDNILPSPVVLESTDRLNGSSLVGATGTELETLVHTAQGSLRRTPTRRDESAHMLELVAQGMPVRSIAAELHLSERQLHRRSIDAFGYGLRTLGRILRFNTAARMLSAGNTVASVATAAGYADQPHFTREYFEFAGTTPGKYRSLPGS